MMFFGGERLISLAGEPGADNAVLSFRVLDLRPRDEKKPVEGLLFPSDDCA